MTEENITPIGEVIRDIIKGRNELVLMNDDVNCHFTSGVIDNLILKPLVRLAKIDKDNQEKQNQWMESQTNELPQ